MSINGNILSFIQHMSPVASSSAKKMEELLYEDPSSSMMKSRLFAEEILKYIFLEEKIDAPHVSSLNDKIIYLSNEGILIPEIQNSFNTIRIVGNKAVHNGSFNDISEAFKLHKTMYKIAVWFYETYSTKEVTIPPYHHPVPPKQNIEDLEGLVKKHVQELMSKGVIVQQNSLNIEQTDQGQINNTDIVVKDLAKGESYLLRELRKLQDSSKEAIENANSFSNFKRYMHVERKVQTELEAILSEQGSSSKSNLVLLCGSVGDGKSHLLAYLKENKPEVINNYQLFNDATESFSPTKNSLETLREILVNFSDEKLPTTKSKVILAINMGVLHNFMNAEHDIPFNKLKSFINNSKLFSSNITTTYSESNFNLISMGDYQSFQITKSSAHSTFFNGLLTKIFANSENNPFYLAYKEDLANQVRSSVHENYEFLQDEVVQNRIVQLIIQAIIKFKLVVSARAFLNFIADILMPDEIEHYVLLNPFDRLDQNVSTLLFKRKDRSPILKCMYDLSPIHRRTFMVDQTLMELNTLTEWANIIDRSTTSKKAKGLLTPFTEYDSLTDYSFTQFSDSLINLSYLTNNEFANNTNDALYTSYIQRLFQFNVGSTSDIGNFYNEIKDSIYKWKGSPLREYLYLNKPSNDIFRLAHRLNLKPSINHLQPTKDDTLEMFHSTILVAYTTVYPSDIVLTLEIDFTLYELLQRVRNGYCPNKKDEEDAIKFSEFLDRIMGLGEKKSELLVYFPSDSRHYKLSKNHFGSFVFERETLK